MPTVPTYSNPQVSPSALPQPQVAVPGIQDVAGHDAQALGQAMQSTGQDVGRIAMDMQNNANQLRVTDAAAQAREHLYDAVYNPKNGVLAQRGNAALERPSGMPLQDEYTANFKKVTDGISNGLGNDAQKQAFAQQAQQMQEQLYSTASSHVAQQYTSWHSSVYDADIKTQANAIALTGSTNAAQIAPTGPDNPDGKLTVIDLAKNSIIRSEVEKARLAGQSADLGMASAKDIISSAHMEALKGMLDAGNYEQAAAYRKQYGDDLNAVDSINLAKALDQVQGLQHANQTISTVMGAVHTSLNPTDAERAANITVQNESGGHQLKPDGTPVIGYVRNNDGSFKLDANGNKIEGGIGKWQVTVGTGQQWAKEMGIPWDENKLRYDENYNTAIGQYGFNKLLKANGGNLDMAWAAYNGGQGGLNHALKTAAAATSDLATSQPALATRIENYNTSIAAYNANPTPAGKASLTTEGAAITAEKARITALVPQADWHNNLLPETQAYVQKNMTAYAAGAGKPTPMTEEDAVNAVVSALPPGTNPTVVATAKTQAMAQYQLVQKGLQQHQAQAYSNAADWLRQNQWDFANMPQSVSSAVPTDKLTELQNLAKSQQLGIPTVTDPATYDKLSDPIFLRGLSDAQFAGYQGKLSDNDWKVFSNKRHALNDPMGGNGPGNLNEATINRVLNDRLQLMGGVDLRPKSTDSDGNARLGMIRKIVNDSILNAQSVAGHKFNDLETTNAIDNVFRHNVSMRTAYLGGMINSDATSTPLMSISKASDVPTDFRAALDADWKRKGRTPTDQDYVDQYIRGKLMTGPKTNGASGSF